MCASGDVDGGGCLSKKNACTSFVFNTQQGHRFCESSAGDPCSCFDRAWFGSRRQSVTKIPPKNVFSFFIFVLTID